MIVAYDPQTKRMAIGTSNANRLAEKLHPKTVEYIEIKMGVNVGEFTIFCKNKVGACAEVSAADQLIRNGAAPEKINFSAAVRPGTVWRKKKITDEDKVMPCENCFVTWPKGD